MKIERTGVDWLSATAKSDAVGIAWYDKFRKLAREGKTAYGDLQSWSNMWYVGQRLGNHARWGYSEKQGYIVILSGELAGQWWAVFAPVAKNISRLDVQVTVKLESAIPDLAESYYLAIQSMHPIDRKAIPAKKFSLHKSTTGGQTLYVGSRQSTTFGRLYDKAAQSPHLGGEIGKLWRYEVEIKKPRALNLVNRLVQCIKNHEHPDLHISSYVYHWFADRSVRPLFKAGENIVEVGYKVELTPVERKIEWLRTQVQPTVRMLLDLGLRKEVGQALDLDALIAQEVRDRVVNSHNKVLSQI